MFAIFAPDNYQVSAGVRRVLKYSKSVSNDLSNLNPVPISLRNPDRWLTIAPPSQ